MQLASTHVCVCLGSQTGSGKTHSTVGKIGDENEAGLLPRAVRHIFEGLCATEGPSEFAVSCSYLEIYKEVRAPTTVGTTRGGAKAGFHQRVYPQGAQLSLRPSRFRWCVTCCSLRQPTASLTGLRTWRAACRFART